MKTPEGDLHPITMFGSEPVSSALERATRVSRASSDAESALIAVALMSGKTPGSREIGARLAVMSVHAADGILPAGGRQTRRSN